MKSLALRHASVLAIGAAALVALAGPVAPAYAASPTTLLETGSSLLYPLFNIWVPVFTAAHTNIQVTTGSTGSGTGQAEAESFAVQIGASDAYLPPNTVSSTGGQMLNIPLAISAQMINYNLPGLNNMHLKLSGTVLADIYTGKVTKWNAAPIAALNKGVKLPNHAIIPLRREDSSGDTFLFTTYMTKSAPKIWTLGFDTSISWPNVKNLEAEEGNSGMVTGLQSTPYSIAYVGISYENQIESSKLGIAELQNEAGKFVLPTSTTIAAAASVMVPKTPPDETLSLIYAPGAGSYPIINYEYAIVAEQQPSGKVAGAIDLFLKWCLTSGQSATFLDQVHFQPLPTFVVHMSEAQVNLVQ